MKYLVLGSSGQIGSALTEIIRDNKQDEVMEFDITNDQTQDLRISTTNLITPSP